MFKEKYYNRSINQSINLSIYQSIKVHSTKARRKTNIVCFSKKLETTMGTDQVPLTEELLLLFYNIVKKLSTVDASECFKCYLI